MILTLSAGGGVTGLTKRCSVNTEDLDEKTRAAVLDYIQRNTGASPGNYFETWSLSNGQAASIDHSKMNALLHNLYQSMKQNLAYRPS